VGLLEPVFAFFGVAAVFAVLGCGISLELLAGVRAVGDVEGGCWWGWGLNERGCRVGERYLWGKGTDYRVLVRVGVKEILGVRGWAYCRSILYVLLEARAGLLFLGVRCPPWCELNTSGINNPRRGRG